MFHPSRYLIFRLPVLILLWSLLGSAWATPLASKGVIDLASLNFESAGSVRLDGDWEFYPGQLLNPATFPPSGSLSPDYLAFPASWNGFTKDGRKLEGSGVATFRLRILPPKKEGDLALRLFDVHSAYRLWLNGKLISAQGVVGESVGKEVAHPSLDMPVFRSDGSPIELVLEVSNHFYDNGGVTSSILIGSEQTIRNEQARQWGIALFFIGALLVMGCYHLFYYCFRRSDAAPLYFGLYCLLWMANFMASNASVWAIRLFIPEISFEFLHRFDLACFFLSIPVGYMFFRSLFTEEFSLRVQKLTQIMGVAFFLLAFLLPVRILLGVVPYYYLISLLLIAYCLLRLVEAHRKRREAAGFILAGFFILGLIAANDMLADLGMIRSEYLIHVGIFIFILAQGFAFSLKFSRSFSAVERLSTELEGRNQALEEEMIERARLESEIVNVSENERRCLSHDLHDGLCQQLTAARLRCSVLERSMGGKELTQLSSLLEESVNHSYDLARGLWPVRLDQHGISSFLEDICRRLAESSGIDIVVRQSRACANCQNESLIQLYRIASEAVSNAVKHARASRIDVSLDCLANSPMIELSVLDNGVGRQAASSSPGGMGMRIMAHRARTVGGELKVEDAEGGGTLVGCKIECDSFTIGNSNGSMCPHPAD
ncbi:MAG: integral rane sensor signal transduction histidine kinase [Proteobacteria bacterium]|nr:integral rane sensor signal transduction histidine kinase [Pseudomonadota bacterium]